jgi:hypothetical protein
MPPLQAECSGSEGAGLQQGCARTRRGALPGDESSIISCVATPHRNHGLFSDHYLENTLPGLPGWDELLEEVRSVRREISEVFERYAPTENEAQTERDLIRPILRLLDHEAFEVQAPPRHARRREGSRLRVL